MARKPRLHYPGAFYHVILRGNAGNDIFLDHQDRSRFFFLLQEGLGKYQHRIHAYCLMTNHVHLAIQVGEIPLSRIIQNVSFRYTRYMNRRREQVGHLFQGRYKALLIDADNYLLELVRYIHNNPVRAGMAKTPDQYTWSSHNAYLGDISIPWLTTDLVLSHFAGQNKQAIEHYRDFVLDDQDKSHSKKFHRGSQEGRILGDDLFAEKALAKAAQKVSRKLTLEQILLAVCEHYGIHLRALSSSARQRQISEARSVAALLVREVDHLSLTDLGRKLKRDVSGVSQAAGRLEKRLEKDVMLAKNIEKIKETIT